MTNTSKTRVVTINVKGKNLYFSLFVWSHIGNVHVRVSVINEKRPQCYKRLIITEY